MLAGQSRAVGKGHAELLFGEIGARFAQAGLTPADIGRIVVAVGPGSFTGVRIGVAAARGLALALAVPVVGVTTLASLTALARREFPELHGRPVMAALDAKRGEVWWQRTEADGRIGAIQSSLIDHFADLIEDNDVVVGTGAIRAGSRRTALAHAVNGDAETLARLGAALDPAQHPPKPLYIRAPDARKPLGFAVEREATLA
jgi:tRNA threonylcarbamoyladenosine biosynthesis protein TsaB